MFLKPDSWCSGFDTIAFAYNTHYVQLGHDKEYSKMINCFPYYKNNYNSFIEAIDSSVQAVQKVLIPLFDQASSISNLMLLFNNIYNGRYSQKLFLLIDDYKEFFLKVKEYRQQELLYSIEHGLNNRVSEKYDEYCLEDEIRISEIVFNLDEISSDTVSYEKMMKVFSKNKNVNIKLLSSVLLIDF